MGRNAHANGAGVLIRAEKTSIHAGDAIRDVLIELAFLVVYGAGVFGSIVVNLIMHSSIIIGLWPTF